MMAPMFASGAKPTSRHVCSTVMEVKRYSATHARRATHVRCDLSEVCKTRLADVAAARKTCNGDIEKQQCGTKGRIQKVTCIKNAIANLGDDCKAAVVAIVTSKK
jgi:hypothetical protein